MRISEERINSLQTLLMELYGIKLSDADARQAGMAIVRFVIAKSQRIKTLNNEQESHHGIVKITGE